MKVSLESEAEFERLVLAHRTVMMRTIWRVVRDPDVAEDVFQDVLAVLWRKLPLVSRHPNTRALVLRICIDQARDAARARARRPIAVSLEDVTLADTDTPARVLERKHALGQVFAAVFRLGTRQATAVLMRALNDEPYEVIANALGCN